jgi:hypothetical protein
LKFLNKALCWIVFSVCRGTIKADQIVLYSEESKAKYGKPQRKAQFKEAMDEIEKDVAEAPEEPAQAEAVPEVSQAATE